jgi:hypothetical protein
MAGALRGLRARSIDLGFGRHSLEDRGRSASPAQLFSLRARHLASAAPVAATAELKQLIACYFQVAKFAPSTYRLSDRGRCGGRGRQLNFRLAALTTSA